VPTSLKAVQFFVDQEDTRVKPLLLVLTMAFGVAVAQSSPKQPAAAQSSPQGVAQAQPTQAAPGTPQRKSPLADYAGTWTGSFEGKTWITVKLVLQGERLSGFIQHAHDLQVNDQGELKSVSDEQSTKVVQDAQVNPNGLLLTTKDPDTQETFHFTMRLTGDPTAEIKMSAMTMPPGMPKIKPWKLTRASAAPAVAPH
jgi:hypothetical protein